MLILLSGIVVRRSHQKTGRHYMLSPTTPVQSPFTDYHFLVTLLVPVHGNWNEFSRLTMCFLVVLKSVYDVKNAPYRNS